MTVYILNALVIPADFEKYSKIKVTIRKASVEEVRQLLSTKGFVSAIGHQGTAQLLTELLGIEIPFNRLSVKLRPGDVCVHFVLKQRIPEGKVLSYEELRQLAFDLAISEVLEHE
jgi:sorbitol-specific phosphotransferase system component IIA